MEITRETENSLGATASTTDPDASASVVFSGVSKSYGSVTAVDDISFAIAPGTLVTLLGPSGCGKTTTLRLIAGLETASSGCILIGNEDVTRLSAAERDVSMVFQSYALFPHMSVLENVAYGPRVQGSTRTHAEAMAREKLDLVGLSGLERRAPSELSGGQQQRVAVARALVLEPKVLLFDEPLSNLDAKLRRRVRDDIRDLQLRLGLTVVYVTHDQEEALAVSDRIIVMSDGRIAQAGTPWQLYEEPANRFVADFIGDANLIEVEIVDEEGGLVSIRVGDVCLTLPARGAAAGRGLLAVRPESFVLHEVRPAVPALSGRVVKSAWLGRHREVTVLTVFGEIFAIDRTARKDRPAVGEEIWLEFGNRGVTFVPLNARG